MTRRLGTWREIVAFMLMPLGVGPAAGVEAGKVAPTSATEVIADVRRAYRALGAVQEEISGVAKDRQGVRWELNSRLNYRSAEQWTLQLSNSLGQQYRFEVEGGRARMKPNPGGPEWKEASSANTLIGGVVGVSAGAFGSASSWTTPMIVVAPDAWVSRLSKLVSTELVDDAEDASGSLVIRGRGKWGTATIWVDRKTSLLRRVQANVSGDETDLTFTYPGR